MHWGHPVEIHRVDVAPGGGEEQLYARLVVHAGLHRAVEGGHLSHVPRIHVCAGGQKEGDAPGVAAAGGGVEGRAVGLQRDVRMVCQLGRAVRTDFRGRARQGTRSGGLQATCFQRTYGSLCRTLPPCAR